MLHNFVSLSNRMASCEKFSMVLGGTITDHKIIISILKQIVQFFVRPQNYAVKLWFIL